MPASAEPGRHHLVIPGDIISDRPGDFVGIRRRVEIVNGRDQSTGFHVLPRRWVVERTFAWLDRYRRLAKEPRIHGGQQRGVDRSIYN